MTPPISINKKPNNLPSTNYQKPPKSSRVPMGFYATTTSPFSKLRVHDGFKDYTVTESQGYHKYLNGKDYVSGRLNRHRNQLLVQTRLIHPLTPSRSRAPDWRREIPPLLATATDRPNESGEVGFAVQLFTESLPKIIDAQIDDRTGLVTLDSSSAPSTLFPPATSRIDREHHPP